MKSIFNVFIMYTAKTVYVKQTKLFNANKILFKNLSTQLIYFRLISSHIKVNLFAVEKHDRSKLLVLDLNKYIIRTK